MKVVLTQNIKGTGKAHTAVDVKDGHALNFLIPKGLAIPATPAVLKQADLRARQATERRELDEKLISERLAALADERIVFVKKANEKGHLYDGIDVREIAEKTGLPAEAISLEKSIKELGTFETPVSYGEQFGKLSIVVEAE